MDSSLVSNKNVSEIFPSSGLGPGPNWPKTYPTYDVTHKDPKHKTKNFFSAARRLAASF